MEINWPEIISIVLSNAVLLATGFVNMQIKLGNLDVRLLGFEKSMDKLVSKVETLDNFILKLLNMKQDWTLLRNIVN